MPPPPSQRRADSPPTAAAAGKDQGAFRTIGEVSRDTGVPAHVLRYWESRFPQLRPVVRAGQRRYYRPEDVALVARIDDLLNHRGYTIRGVQKLLNDGARTAGAVTGSLDTIRQVRDSLAAALADD